MTVAELSNLIQARCLTPGLDAGREVTCGYACDLLSWVLLSWVMGHGQEGMAWVTVQTHMNVVAVAVLAEMACVILPESIDMEEESLNKAISEDMIVLSSPLTSYEICGRLNAAGIPGRT